MIYLVAFIESIDKRITMHARLTAVALLLTSSCFQPVEDGAADAAGLDAGEGPSLDAGDTDGAVPTDAGSLSDAGEPTDGGDLERVLIRGSMITVCDASQHEAYSFVFSATEQPPCGPWQGIQPYRLSLSPPLAVGPMTPPRGALTVDSQGAIYNWAGSIDSVTPWLITGRIDTWLPLGEPHHDRFVAAVCPLRLGCRP